MASTAFRDITGQRFVRLVALAPAGYDSTGKTLWACACDCGRFSTHTMLNLVKNVAKSCGCLRHQPSKRRADLRGQRFGRLIALEALAGAWRCACDCGGERVTATRNLVLGKTRSCGCLRARNDEKKAERSQARNMVDRDGWPKRVLAQAGWQCDACGSTENLHAHHILPFAKFPQFRCLDDNGAALCRSCHVDVHRLINSGVTAGDALVEVLLRAGRKEGTDDVGKAEHYRQFLTEWDAKNGK